MNKQGEEKSDGDQKSSKHGANGVGEMLFSHWYWHKNLPFQLLENWLLYLGWSGEGVKKKKKAR